MENDCSSYMHKPKNWKNRKCRDQDSNPGYCGHKRNVINHYTITATFSDVQSLIYSLMNYIKLETKKRFGERLLIK